MPKLPIKKRYLFLAILIFTVISIYLFVRLVTYFKPENYELRSWIDVDLYRWIIVLIQVCIVYIAILFRIWKISKIKSDLARLFADLAVIFTASIPICILAVILILTGFWDYDISNDNGTITKVYTSFHGSDMYGLFEKKGLLYKKSLRPMKNKDDIDPSITAEQWALMYNPPVTKDTDTAPSEESTLPSEPSEEYEETEEEIIIREGYSAICDEFFPSSNYRFEYTAKGYPYLILEENQDTIKYIEFYRISKNERCNLYVLYSCKKASDGSFSPPDASLQNIFAYEIETGKVVASGKTKWDDVGSDEYREISGE